MQPVAPRERLATLDVLRGCALFGVLVGNLHMLYAGRWFTLDAAAPSALDTASEWFIWLAVEGRAQSLLTLLFGFGFAIQLLRATERGEPVMALYVRRLVVLFAFGWMHVLLLWWGDVTWGYAVAGFALLPFRGVSNRARLIWAAIFIFVPPVIDQLPGVMGYFATAVFGPQCFERLSASTIAAFHGHDRAALTIAHAKLGVMWSIMDFGYPLWLVGHFLIGYVIGMRRWFDRDGADHLATFRKLLIWCVPITACGLAWTIAARSGLADFRALPMPAHMAIVVLDQLALLAQVGIYVAAIVLLMQRAWWRRLLSSVAPVGRMPLTTYFTQSLVCTFVFYGWGMNEPMASVAGELAIAAAIFAGQVAIAHVWLRYFNFGPLEWLWRAAVYLKAPIMRKVRS
jgi:uncharacterized protein